MNVFRVLNSDVNENGSLFYRLQCLVSADVSVLYESVNSPYNFTDGQTVVSTSAKWETSEVGTLLSGLFLPINSEKATDLVITEKAKPFRNTLTAEQKTERRAAASQRGVEKVLLRRSKNVTFDAKKAILEEGLLIKGLNIINPADNKPIGKVAEITNAEKLAELMATI